MMTSSNGNISRVTGQFVRGIHRPPVNSPHKGQWRGALMFSLICAWIKGWINNGEAGDLRRHRAWSIYVWFTHTLQCCFSGNGQPYSISQEICTRFCCALLCCGYAIVHHEVFTYIHQGCFAGTGAIVILPQCQWSKPDGYGKISQCITTTKHSKAKTVCIFLGLYCMFDTVPGKRPGEMSFKLTGT